VCVCVFMDMCVYMLCVSVISSTCIQIAAYGSSLSEVGECVFNQLTLFLNLPPALLPLSSPLPPSLPPCV